MRKLLLLGALAALGTALIATSASANFEVAHFTLRGHDFKLHQISKHRISYREKLRKHGARVGTKRGRCRQLSKHESKCHVNYFLNGKVGGRGHIHAVGRYTNGHGDRFNVTGGTAQFNGVGGKIILSDDSKEQFHLVR
jgi:hypothetical protein